MNFKYKVFKGIEEILVDTEEFPSEIIPVVLGNTLNSQSYSLEFNRETGGKTIVVGSEENWSTRGSSLISLIISDSILDVLEKLKRKDTRTVLLLGSTDESVETIVNLKDLSLIHI